MSIKLEGKKFSEFVAGLTKVTDNSGVGLPGVDASGDSVVLDGNNLSDKDSVEKNFIIANNCNAKIYGGNSIIDSAKSEDNGYGYYAFFIAFSDYVSSGYLNISFFCEAAASKNLAIGFYKEDKRTIVGSPVSIGFDEKGCATFSKNVSSVSDCVYIRLLCTSDKELFKNETLYIVEIISYSDSLSAIDLEEINEKLYPINVKEDGIYSLSLENRLYQPHTDEPLESKGYWSIVRDLKKGDVVGCLDSSLWSDVKMNYGVKGDKWEGYIQENLTIPYDGKWVIAFTRVNASFTPWDESVNKIFGKVAEIYKISEESLSKELKEKVNEKVSYLCGKKLTCLGDSLTHGMRLSNNQTWGYKIAERNGMTFYNYGVDGNPIASTNEVQGMVERYVQMPDGCDYITVMGGANDLNREIPIGTNSDTSIYTFKGAINTLIDGLRAKYPSGHICFMTNFKRYPATNEKLYVDAMIEVCRLKAIPCKNNYEESGIDFTNQSQCSVFEHPDAGKHFSEAGNEFISYGIEEFLKSH